MDKPTKLAFSDEATFSFTQGVVLIPIIFILSSYLFFLIATDATLADLGLPFIGMGGMVAILIGIFGSVALGHRISEILQINRMFAREIWECWQFSAPEWEAQVESVCNLISPKSEGKEAFSGVIASSIFGLVIALVLIAVSIFAVDVPEVKSALRIAAAGLFVFMIGVGLFQPMVAKNKAERYRRKALRFSEPRVWFGPDGVYHEALGHTSLKELHKVTDQTKSRNRIQFTLLITSADSDDIVKFHTPVPSGCELRAGSLVRRYREEIIQR